VKLSDAELMQRFQERLDEEAFDEPVGRHYRSAQALARLLLHDAMAAEDAVQDAFIRIVRRRLDYSPSRPFSPWFYQILRNVCIDARRKRERHRRKMDAFADIAATGPVRSHGQEWRELLDMLSPEDKEVLVLRFVGGVSVRDLAEHLGCSVEAAKKRGQRALARMRALKQRLDSQPGCAARVQPQDHRQIACSQRVRSPDVPGARGACPDFAS